MAVLEPPPLISPIAEGKRELMQSDWQKYFLAQSTVLTATSTFFTTKVALTNQNTSIGTTNVPLPALTAGDYVFFYYARVTVADGVSSSLTITLRWTEGAVSLSLAGPAMTGNSTTTVQSGVVPVFIDGATPLAYSTTYASNTPGVMRYTLRIRVQSLQ